MALPDTESQKSNRIAKLPPEILCEIFAYLPSAHDVRSIATACRMLHLFTEKEGWKVFVKNRFPSITTPGYWKDSAHALTTLSRNLDRRALIARHLEPKSRVYCLPSGEVRERWTPPSVQTMGYQAMVDSHEEWTANDWTSRREVVSWGAGATLIIRKSMSGSVVQQQWEKAEKGQRRDEYDAGRSKVDWLTFREPFHREGNDDITTVKLVPNMQDSFRAQSGEQDDVIVGRASGELVLLRLEKTTSAYVKHFNTSSDAVRTIAVSSPRSGLLGACLDAGRLALFSLHTAQKHVPPISTIQSVTPAETSCRTWSTTFLSDDKLAIARGPSKDIAQVYDIGANRLHSGPLRTFGSGGGTGKTSAYPVVGVPDVIGPTSAANVFLTGGYDGIIRLHDMRSRNDCESLITDPSEFSPVFSLAMIGRERVIAGAATHSLLKFFDLRMCNGRAYSYLDAASPHIETRPKYTSADDGTRASGFNLFGYDGRSGYRSDPQRMRESPVYTLSRPSQSSTSLYAGMENRVVHFNFTQLTDQYPDPVFRYALKRTKRHTIDPLRSWWPSIKSNFNLVMYEQVKSGDLPMLRQRGPDPQTFPKFESIKAMYDDNVAGYDQRWMWANRGFPKEFVTNRPRNQPHQHRRSQRPT